MDFLLQNKMGWQEISISMRGKSVFTVLSVKSVSADINGILQEKNGIGSNCGSDPDSPSSTIITVQENSDSGQLIYHFASEFDEIRYSFSIEQVHFELEKTKLNFRSSETQRNLHIGIKLALW